MRARSLAPLLVGYHAEGFGAFDEASEAGFLEATEDATGDGANRSPTGVFHMRAISGCQSAELQTTR
ncbi:MAG TPA: hypothetical protein VFQ30_13760 [Ktedonobacteraceae bacterium]|nr:hypothetical protein [Ktedonobacteraceae bacterium]